MTTQPQLPVPLRADSPTLARRLGISVAAVELSRDCEIIDLHLDTFIPPRLWGYRVHGRHRGGPLGRHFFGHVDLPRLQESGLSGAMWSITTNPFRTPAARWRTFQRNVRASARWCNTAMGPCSSQERCRSTAQPVRAAPMRSSRHPGSQRHRSSP